MTKFAKEHYLVGQILGFLLGFGFVPIYVYYFLAEEEQITKHWHEYVPLRRSPLRDEVVSVLAEISQVLVNVLTNAAQAMGGKGDIFIELQRGLRCWELIIRDTGPGIKPHLMERIFDPGFTTKGVGVGTGLGLSISAALVKLMGGTMWVESTPDVGSTFFFSATLKASSEAVPEDLVPEAGALVSHSILIVDDNATNRRIMEIQLKMNSIDF